MTAAPQPKPDPAEDLVFRCLESGDSESELAAVEREDPALAARARRLLADLADDGLLDQPGPGPDLPQRVGHYRIDRKLGEGGMGIVFEATDTELDRRVAVKLVRPDMLPFGKTGQRFENEIEALARLDHPGIARVLRAGEHDGLRYYAMEFVDGESLAEVLARLHGRDPTELRGRDLFAGRLEPVAVLTTERSALLSASWVEACLRIVHDTAVAIAHAHQHGILHRDIKPANVMLGRDGRVRVLDFGLARADDRQTMTRTGSAIGSLAYMAPEQIRGDRDQVGAATDVRALGLLLYELLALRPPFLVKDNEQRTRDRILRGRCEPVRRFNPSVPHDVARLLRRALRTAPAARPATATVLAGELDTLRQGRSEALGPPLRRLVRSHPMAFAIATATAAVAAVIGAAGWLQQASTTATVREEHRRLASRAAAVRAENGRYRRALYETTVLTARRELSEGQLEPARFALHRIDPALRGWEWDVLHRRATLDAAMHKPALNRSAWEIGITPARYVFGFGWFNRVSVMDRASGRSRVIPLELPDAFTSAISADTSIYCVLPKDQPTELHVLRVDSERVHTQPLDAPGVGLALAPNGETAAILHADGTITLRSTADGAVTQRLSHASGESFVTAIGTMATVSPDGTVLAAATRAGEVLVWRIADGGLAWRQSLAAGSATALAFSPDSSELFTVAQFDQFERWLVDSGERLAYAGISTDSDGAGGKLAPAKSIHVDPDRRHLWLVGTDSWIRCRDIASGTRMTEFPSHEFHGDKRWITASALDVQGQRLLVSNRYEEIWDHDLATIKSRWLHAGDGLVRPAMNENGDLIAASTALPPMLRERGKRTTRLEALPPAHRVVFASESRVVFAPVHSPELLIYDLATAAVAGRLIGHDAPVHALAMTGSRLLSGSEDGSVRLWNLESLACEGTFVPHDDIVTEVLPLDDGQRFASVSYDGALQITATSSGQSTGLVQRSSQLYGLAVSPDGRWLATGGKDKGVSIWDLTEQRAVPGPIGNLPVAACAFTPDGRQLILASHKSSKVRVYRVGSWERAAVLQAPCEDRLHFAQFAPDGRTLVTSSYGSVVDLWTIQ